MERTIAACRELIGVPPRPMSPFALWCTKMPVPMWVRLRRDLRFREIFRNQANLLKRGRVVWGAVVQANSLLFEPGRIDCPAAILYSLDSRVDQRPDVLTDAASMLFETKGRGVQDPEVRIFAEKLADEMVMDMKLAVPARLTRGVRCFYTCIMVHRKHLPDRKLSSGLFPILVNPEETEATMILPSKYWPSAFAESWQSDEES